MCMIGVQIYYTVYDRRTRVLYAVAVAVAEYAVGMIQICLADNYRSMAQHTEYHCYLCINNSILHRDISAYASDTFISE